MSLLTAAADSLEAAAAHHDASNPDASHPDASHPDVSHHDDGPPGEEFSRLAERIRRYLAVSRSTTPLGLPHVLTAPQNLLTDEMVIRDSDHHSHVRIVPG